MGILIIGLGCGTPAPIKATSRPAATTVTSAGAVGSATAQSTASAPASPPLPEGSRAPIQALALSSVACEQPIASVLLTDEKAKVRLCDAAGKLCFLQSTGEQLSGADLTAAVAQGDKPSVLVRFGYEGLVLRGFITDPPRWYAARPIAFGGFYVADRIEVKAGRDKQLVVAPPLVEDWVKPERPVLQTLPCADVAWNRPEEQEEAKKKRLGIRGEADHYNLQVGEETKLHDASGTLVARLKPTETMDVKAYQKAGARQLIVIELSNGTLFGWVARSALRELRARMGRGHSGRASFQLVGVRQPHTGVSCAADVPLLALVGGERLGIGHIQGGTWFSLGAPLDTLHTEVLLRHPLHKEDGKLVERVGLTVLDGARLAVQNDAIATCERN